MPDTFHKVGTTKYSFKVIADMWVVDWRGISRSPGDLFGTDVKPTALTPGIVCIDAPKGDNIKVHTYEDLVAKKDKSEDKSEDGSKTEDAPQEEIPEETEEPSDEQVEEVPEEPAPPEESQPEENEDESALPNAEDEFDAENIASILDMSVGEIVEYVSDPENKINIHKLIDAEKSGKARKSLIDKLSDM